LSATARSQKGMGISSLPSQRGVRECLCHHAPLQQGGSPGLRKRGGGVPGYGKDEI